MIREYAISIHRVGDFTIRTNENVIDFNDLIHDRYPELVGSYRVTVFVSTRDPVTNELTSIFHITMRIQLP